MAEQSNQASHQFNRLTPAHMFECHLHPEDHDAEVFVIYRSVFGTFSVPVCIYGFLELVEELKNGQGIRSVSSEQRQCVSGTIEGVLSSR